MISKVVLLLCVFASGAQDAFAQDRMWFFSPPTGAPTVVTQIDVTDMGRNWSATARWTLSTGYPPMAKVPLQGGRYLVWLALADDGFVLAYLDTRSGQNGVIPGWSFRAIGGDLPSITVDRRSSRVIVLDTRGIWILDPRTASVKLISLPSRIEARTVQAAGGRVFVTHRPFFVDAPEVLVIDPESGAQLAAFPRAQVVEFTRDEKSFFLVSNDARPPYTRWLSRHDMATLARVSNVQFENTSTLLDNIRLTDYPGQDGITRVQVHDANGSKLLAEVLPGVYTGRVVRFWRPGPRSPIYAEHYRYSGSFYDNLRIDAIDPSTATIVQSVSPTFDFTGGLFPTR